MFGLGGDKKQKLEEKYRRLMEESVRLSHSNRIAGDRKMAEADAVLKQIEAMEQTQG